MNNDAPDDLQGCLINCQHRAKLIADALTAFSDTDAREPSKASYLALGDLADELAAELDRVERLYVKEANGRDSAKGGA